MTIERKNKINSAWVVLVILSQSLLFGCNDFQEENNNQPSLDAYNKLIWEENFDSLKLNTSSWQLLDSHYWNHGEQEVFLTDKRNIRIKDGILTIFCRKEENPITREALFTSACLKNININLPEYGRVDVRAKMAFGKGVMSAISLKPLGDTKADNMADALELAVVNGSTTEKVIATIRYTEKEQKERHMAEWNITGDEKDYARGFHTYTLIREGKKIWYFVDGKMFFHVSDDLLYPNNFRFEDDYSLCFHISVGSKWTGKPDPVITAFPQKMEVDYVKVYEKSPFDISDDNQEVEFPDLHNYESMVWNDEFDQEGISENYWTHETGDYWYNNEIQAYTNDTTNSYISNGKLVINAMPTPEHVQSVRDYTSARLITKDKVLFGYGRIDFRIKVESGKGIWPAAWLLPNDNKFGPWPSSGEIDVLEIFGSDSLTQHMTVHFGKDRNDHRTRGGKLHNKSGFNDKFHTYSLIREKDNMWFYFDEKPCFHVSRDHIHPHYYPFNEDFYAILNLAVGGGTAGYPDESTPFPRKMWVDYVRYYKRVRN